MPVTRAATTISAGWTAAQLADTLFRDSLIASGLMSAWHATFNSGGTEFRVMRIQHDNTKTYGFSFYYFSFVINTNSGVCLVTGWDGGTNNPAGTQFLDWHIARPVGTGGTQSASVLTPFLATTSAVTLYRYTSQIDTNQSWFVCEQNTTRSAPFTFLPGTATLQSWQDLDRGPVNGYINAIASANATAAFMQFRVPENLRRVVGTGTCLRGETSTSGNTLFHEVTELGSLRYAGLGHRSNNTAQNVTGVQHHVILPVGRNATNPAYSSDLTPLCTGLPISQQSNLLLAADFAIYMHYAHNTMVFGDRFIVSAGVEEWEVLTVALSTFSLDGANSCFLARVV